MRLKCVFGCYGTMIDSKKPINGKKLNGKCLPLSFVQSSTLSALPVMLLCCTVEPRLSGLVETLVNSPDNRESG